MSSRPVVLTTHSQSICKCVLCLFFFYLIWFQSSVYAGIVSAVAWHPFRNAHPHHTYFLLRALIIREHLYHPMEGVKQKQMVTRPYGVKPNINDNRPVSFSNDEMLIQYLLKIFTSENWFRTVFLHVLSNSEIFELKVNIETGMHWNNGNSTVNWMNLVL